MRTTRDFFREQAERSRKLAARAEDAEIRAHLISVAEQYDSLAEKEKP